MDRERNESRRATNTQPFHHHLITRLSIFTQPIFSKMNGGNKHIPITPYTGATGTTTATNHNRDRRQESDIADAAHSATLNDYNRQGIGKHNSVSEYFGAEFVRNPDGKTRLFDGFFRLSTSSVV